MRIAPLFFLAACMATLLAIAAPAHAYWVEDGVEVCTQAASQSFPVIAPDGSGGFLIAWLDQRNGNNDIFAQRISVSGMPLWAADGVAVNTDPSYAADLQICEDGAGGAILSWRDGRNGNDDIYAQRIGPSGTARWTTNGIAVCTNNSTQQYPYPVPDGSGGAVIVWEDWRNGNVDVYAQRIDAAGYVWWAYDGVGACTAANNQVWIRPVPDGMGGVITAFMDLRNVNYDIYAQRMDGSGAVVWTSGGVAICTQTSVQGNPSITEDGLGGAIITWMDQRNEGGGVCDIYAQRISPAGAVQWGVNGAAVCSQPGSQFYSYCAPDGAGGAVICWLDDRTQDGRYQVYAQRIDPAGIGLWATGGVRLSAQPYYQYEARICPDGEGGAVVSWLDNYNVRVQRVDSGGAAQWGSSGILLCGAADYQDCPRIMSNGAGGAVVVWHDSRVGNYDIYAGNIDANGELYDPAPVIARVADVPADQGGQVWLEWDASRDETYAGNLVTHYTIWRAIDPVAAVLAGEQGRPVLAAADGIPADLPKGTVRVETLGGASYYWQLMEMQDIYYQPAYALPLETLCDSTEYGTGYHYFQVVAQTIYPATYFASAPDSGYSVDNLAPCAPLCLAGEQSFVPEGLVLSWAPNAESDLDEYRVYRDVGPGFAPGPGNLLASLCDTIAFDGDWAWDSGYCYKVAAVDVHGNESGYALLCSEEITGDEPAPLPAASFLEQNRPNPFNPGTVIAFGIQERAHVSLRIYDAAGRLVASLLDEARPAGQHTIEWNGRRHDGAAAASGVYFYRLRAGTFEQTRKMVLLK
ncbi:MAG: FlgD immunoglobulin-like domain containing protein [Candidatus Krumholzibacteria bacterium]|nr:FlgD immunoglobulin-like domain containing protein [Candidatus Krumholzibacteria bacterium]